MGIELKFPELPKFRVSYAHLEKPRKIPGADKELYSVMALFEPGADLSAVKKVMLEAMKEKFGTKAEAVAKHPKFKSPLKDQSDLVNAEGDQRPGTKAGAIFINLSSEDKPLLIGQDRVPTDDHRVIYSGCYAVGKVEVYAWEHETGGKGVSFNLLGLMKVGDGDRLGGSGARADVSDFDGVPVENPSDASDVFG